jgi:hypothetical protein
MAEAFPQQEPFEHRTGNVIRRRGGEHHHEKVEHDYVFDYVGAYGNTSEQKRGENLGMPTGRNFERILGTPDIETINTVAQSEGIALHRIKKEEGRTDGYSLQWYTQGHWSPIDPWNLKRCFDLVKQHQGENDPKNPTHPVPRKLRKAVEQLLSNRQKDQGQKEVLYFASVGTPLDYSPDIDADAFFEINGKIITLDLTGKEDKPPEELRADVLISLKDIFMVDELYLAETPEQKKLAEAAYEQQINALAERIIHVYEQRTQKAA